MPRRDLEVPEATEDWVQDAFGALSNSRAEAYRMALAYAKRQWELEQADD